MGQYKNLTLNRPDLLKRKILCNRESLQQAIRRELPDQDGNVHW
jgi:hypothetical protein